jgi:hypothetical protein
MKQASSVLVQAGNGGSRLLPQRCSCRLTCCRLRQG